MPGSEVAMGSDKLNVCLRPMEQYGLIKMTPLAHIGWSDIVKATTRPPPEPRMPESHRPGAIRLRVVSRWSCKDEPGGPWGFSWMGRRPDSTQRKEDPMP